MLFDFLKGCGLLVCHSTSVGVVLVVLVALATQSQFPTAKPAFPASFTGMCIKPWHEGKNSGTVNPSKRPRQLEAICGTKKSKKRLRRL